MWRETAQLYLAPGFATSTLEAQLRRQLQALPGLVFFNLGQNWAKPGELALVRPIESKRVSRRGVHVILLFSSVGGTKACTGRRLAIIEP